MITADWVAVGLTAFFCLVGYIAGFGKGLKFFTSGVFGFLISVLVCYCLGGFIYKLGFVQELLAKLIAAMTGKNGFCDFLIKIHIEVAVYYVVLFIIVSIIRVFAVLIIKSIVETDNAVLKVINRVLGMILFLAVFAMGALFVFHIISLLGGTTEAGFLEKLDGSFFRLDKVFEDNPVMTIIEYIRRSKLE